MASLIIFLIGNIHAFLDAFAKLRKATISFVISVCPIVCPSVRPHGTTRLPLDGFGLNLTFELLFDNLSRKFKFR